MEEQWKPIIIDGVSYKNYEISTHGRVRTMNYKGTGEIKVLNEQLASFNLNNTHFTERINNYDEDLRTREAELKEANLNLEKGLEQIRFVAEAYPELKANENFMQLSDSLNKVEEDIANARKYYNATVRKYNDKVEMFPSLIVAKLFGYKTRKMFEVSGDERKNVIIDM